MLHTSTARTMHMCRLCYRHKHWPSDLTACGAAGPNDGVLRWLEEFAGRLAAGQYQVATFTDAGVPRTPALSLFDLARPNTSEAVRLGAWCSSFSLAKACPDLKSPSGQNAGLRRTGLMQACFQI
jgi:hypothetical protein